MRDLTKGSPAKLILTFAIPIFLGNIFQLFYSLVDTRIVGVYLGEEALAAVGATNSLSSMLIGFLMGITNGFAIIVARFFGAGDYKKMRKSVAATFVLGIGTALVFTVFCVGMLSHILTWLNTPQDIIDTSYSYIRIILLGMTLSMLYNVCASTLRAIGDSVTPLVFLIISTILNVGLDLLFIVAFHQGVEGAAVATILSQGLSVVLCMSYMFWKYQILRLHREDFKLEVPMVKEMYTTGLSMAFMVALVNIGSVVLQSAINGFGQNIIVAHTAARKLTEMFMLPFQVFGMTMATYCSQNMGAGKYDRIHIGIKQALLMSGICCLLTIVAAYTIAPILLEAVTGSLDEEIIGTASLYLRINTLLYFVTANISILRNSLQGIGEKRTPIFSSFLELVGKVLIVLLLTPRIGYMGIIVSEPIIWCIMVIPLFIKAFQTPVLGKKYQAESVLK